MIFGVNRFHIFAFLTWQLSIFFAGMNIFGIFANYSPKWKCGDGGVATKNCSVLLNCRKEDVRFVDVQFKSAAMEFEWLCGSKVYYQSLFNQIQYVGVLLGTVTFGLISDSIGRKPTGIFVYILAISMAFLSGMAPNEYILLLTRFFIGLGTGGILVVICTWIMEVIEAQQRMFLRGLFNWGWTRIFLTLICWICQEWRSSAILFAAVTIPAIVLVSFVIPESPTWLHNKGKKVKLVKSEMHMAKMAGIYYRPKEHKKVIPKTIMETLRGKGNLKKLMVLWTMWFIASVCGFANDLNSNSLSGDLYVNQVLFGIILVISKMVLLFVDTHYENFKRRTLHQGAQLVTILFFIVLTLFLLFNYQGLAFLIIYLLGTVFIEYTWDACYLCAIESMETPCRASATGTCSFVARLGAICAPILNYANTIWPPAVFVTVVTLGAINLVVSYLYLEETKNIDLDRVEDSTEEQREMISKS